jgi:hypothetical protein
MTGVQSMRSGTRFLGGHMGRFMVLGAVGLASVLVLVIALVSATAVLAAGPVNHGISFTKGCQSPTHVGQPYTCTYSIRNNVDEAQDTLTVTGLADTLQSAGGPVGSGNVITSLKFEIGAGSPTCNGIGSGTAADPFRNATVCTLPFGSRLNVEPFTFYTVQAADFNLPGHVITDSAELIWHDLCNDPAGTGNTNCVANPPNVGAGSQSLVVGLTSTTTSQIHNAAHAVVTAVEAGSTVHDFVTVSGGAGNPVPTGSVSMDWFLNGSCSGSPAATSAAIPLGPGGTVDATSFPFTVNAAGTRAFRAHYLGDPANPVYDPADSGCEPLSVVDANVSITPNGVNRIGRQHTLTGHVNVVPDTGPVSAPDGTTISFSINGGPPSQQCTTSGGTGSCQVSYASAVTGVDTVVASTTVSVGGVSLARQTDGTHGSSGPATKRWVNARISISPNAATAAGAPQTLTVTLQQDIGDGAGFVVAPGQHVDVTLTDAGGAAHTTPTGTCTDTGPNTDANGQCTITFTSNSAGTTTGHATSTVSVDGSAPFTVSTGSGPPNGPDAVTTWQQATQTITFTSTPPNPALVGGSYAPSATGGGSGNPIVFSIDSSSAAGACKLGGGTVSFTGPGLCVVDADQAGNATYLPAVQKQQSFTIGFSSTVSGTVNGHLTVSPGQVVSLAPGTTVTGSTSVQNGGILWAQGVTFKGSFSATGSAGIHLCGSTLGGALTVTGSTGLVVVGDDDGPTSCAGNSIAGSAGLTGNHAGVEFDGNTVKGSLTITGNTGSLPSPDSGAVDAVANNVKGRTTIQP